MEPALISAFDEDTLLGLDLRSYNNGVNPYGDADHSIDRTWIRGADHYRTMIQQRTRFGGQGRVLDLLCGFGRWLPFLAECNEEVVGIDKLDGCIRIAEGICRDLKLDNVELRSGDVSDISMFPDGHFDAIWMWSGLQYVHRGVTLSEISRLLKPGGRVFNGAYNGPGLMVDHVLNGVRGAGVSSGASLWALGSLRDGEFCNGNPNFLSPEGATRLLPTFGLNVVAASEEGGLDLSAPDGRLPGFTGRKNELGLSRTVEFIAEKPHQPIDVEGLLQEKLRGNASDVAETVAMLKEDGIASLETIIGWLSHEDEAIRSGAVEILKARGPSILPRLERADTDKAVVEKLIADIKEQARTAQSPTAGPATTESSSSLLGLVRKVARRLLR